MYNQLNTHTLPNTTETLNENTHTLQSLREQIEQIQAQLHYTGYGTANTVQTAFQKYFINNPTETEQENKNMSNLIFAYENPKLRIGDKIRLATMSELAQLGRTHRTATYGSKQEKDFTGAIFTVTEKVYKAFTASGDARIYYRDFPEYSNSDYLSWVFHCADFVMAEPPVVIKEVPAYQLLKIDFEKKTAENILLSFSKEKIETAQEGYKKTNTNDKVDYIVINFMLKSKIKE